MVEDTPKIAESIRSGRYFSEARGWYQAVYIGAISERTFFLIIAVLAGFVACVSILSLVRLMPITTRPAVVIPVTERFDEVLRHMAPLRGGTKDAATAVEEFFVLQYVLARESYGAQGFQANVRFVRGQSDPATYNAYAQEQDVSNPQSRAALLGQEGQRVITLQSIQVNADKVLQPLPPVDATGVAASVDTHTARVRFTAETAGGTSPTKSQWTAQIKYHYTKLDVAAIKNDKIGGMDTHITDPEFQVVSYVVEPDVSR